MKIPCWCQRWMGRLIRDDRKVTLTQQPLVTTKICRIPSLNPQHIELKSRWASAAEDHTGCRSCQLRTGNGGYNSYRLTKIGIKNMKAWIHPALSQRLRTGVMVWGIFSWHTLGPLVPIEHRLNYLCIVADYVHPFMTTVYPSSDNFFQQDNASCHKAQIISDWFLEHDNEFTLLK